MNINGINRINQFASIATKTQSSSQADKTSTVTANSTAANTQKPRTAAPAAHYDMAGRIAMMPNLEQYEALIQRFLSGESKMENYSSNAPLTQDQIALRGFMRELQRTDRRSLAQVQMDMTRNRNIFNNYWVSSGNMGSRPAVSILHDGTFQIHKTKEEHADFVMNQKFDILKAAMSVINSRRASI